MTGHIFFKILILVIFIVLVAGGIFAWQYCEIPKEKVKDEIADWKTYRNEEYGFEIKYPPEIKKIFINPKLGQFTPQFLSSILFRWVFKKTPTDEVAELQVWVLIEIYDNPNFIPITEFYPKLIEDQGYVRFLVLHEKSEIVMAGVKGLKVKLATEGEEWEEIYLPKNSKVYMLTYGMGGDLSTSDIEKKKWENNFNQMLSTFRFLE